MGKTYKEMMSRLSTCSDETRHIFVQGWDACTRENMERLNFMIQKLTEEETLSKMNYTPEITLLKQMAYEINNLGEKLVE